MEAARVAALRGHDVFRRGTLLSSNWKDNKFVLRNNLYWNASRRKVGFAGQSFKQWQARGHDRGSRIADPQFVDPDRYDFRLKPTSPALKLGFKPFDPSSTRDIEKAIQASDLGITPNTDGRIIRLPVPALSLERRKQLAGQLKKMAEQARVTIRNIRREANKDVDKEEKQATLTEDHARKCKDEIQKLTDKYVDDINTLLEEKEKEILEI